MYQQDAKNPTICISKMTDIDLTSNASILQLRRTRALKTTLYDSDGEFTAAGKEKERKG